jgi:eukaryotic-like serine/threonine-protein kinase
MIGQILNDRYRITALLGEGAMGEVYRATDTQTSQEVALKVITQKLALNEEMLARFRREGEALRHLRHQTRECADGRRRSAQAYRLWCGAPAE